MKKFFSKLYDLFMKLPVSVLRFLCLSLCFCLLVVCIVSCESIKADTYNKTIDNKHVYYQHNMITSDSDYSGNVSNDTEVKK